MADTVTSPNMNLVVPVPSTAPGPLWAQSIYACLYATVDQHNHSAGQGVPIQPSGLNISSNLPFNNHSATLMKTSAYQDQGSSLSSATLGATYMAGGNLYFNAGSDGFAVQITNGHSVNGSSGTISGLPSGTASASYATGKFTFQSATSTAANIDGGSLIIREVVASANGVTLSSPSGLAANYTLVMPAALPGATSFMGLDASGNISAYAAVSGGITAANLAANSVATASIQNNAVTPGKLSALNTSSSSYSTTSTTSTSPVAVTGGAVSLTATGGRPVWVTIHGSNGGASCGITVTNTASQGSGFIRLDIGVGDYVFPFANIAGSALGVANSSTWPVLICFPIFPSAGPVTATMSVYTAATSGTTTVQLIGGLIELTET